MCETNASMPSPTIAFNMPQHSNTMYSHRLMKGYAGNSAGNYPISTYRYIYSNRNDTTINSSPNETKFKEVQQAEGSAGTCPRQVRMNVRNIGTIHPRSNSGLVFIHISPSNVVQNLRSVKYFAFEVNRDFSRLAV